MPRSLYIETSSRCNLKCTTCALTYDPKEPGRELDWEAFVRLVDQFPELDRVVLHGLGEPLLNRDLARMVAYCKGKGAAVLFNTNGILLTRDRQAELIDAGLDELRVSLDAATPETFLRVRGAPAFERIMANIASLQALKAERGLRQPKITLFMTGMKENIHELPDLVRAAARAGADEVNLQRLVFFGVGMAVEEQSIWLHATQREEEIIAESAALAAQLGVRLVASGNTSAQEYLVHGTNPAQEYLEYGTNPAQPWSACRRPFTLSYITANGNVLPCCFAPWIAPDYNAVVFGNVFDQPFTEIWEGPAYQEFRRALLSSEPSPCCRGCGVKWSL